jgi:DHA2 family multidrug resistance protein-like MFS transporter
MTTFTSAGQSPVGDTPRRAGRREWIALAVLMLPLTLVSMDVSILYFAVPFIARDLEPSATQQLWIFDVYGFVLAGLLITMGSIGDRIGRRRLLLVGAVGFGAASFVAAYSTSAEMLIAARAVLGVSGATLMPSTLALIRNLFHDERERATAVSIWTAVTGGGVALGPVISGVLLSHFWWGSVFLVNLPFMVLLVVLVPLLVPEFRAPAAGRFDVAGSILSLATVLPVIWGLKELAAHGFATAYVASVVAGAGFGYAFLRRQRTAAHPLMDLALFRQRRFSGFLSANLVAMFALVGNAIFTTQYLQSVLDMTPLRAALWSVVPTVAVVIAAPLAMTAAQRVGRARVAAAGFVVAALGFGVLTVLGRAHGLLTVLVGAGILAVGLVSVMTIASESALAVAPAERAGSASAVLETSSELGGALGMAVLGSIGAAVYRHQVDVHLSAGVPGTAASVVRETLGGALAVADDLPGRLGAGVASVARDAFVSGMNVAAGFGVVLMLLAASLVLAAVRGPEA